MTSESKQPEQSKQPELSDQQVLMGSLPYILLNGKKLIKKPKYYIRTRNTDYETGPSQRLARDKQEDLAAILKMNNIEAASLVPKIQFWKVITEPNTGKITDEIYIPYSYDARNYVENIFGNRQNRGDDVGIKNVSFVYDNQNPAVAETLLGCTIDFVFDNAEALIIQRGAGDKKFRYVDLFAFEQTTANDKIDRGKYDIILKVGYEIDGVMEIQSQEVRDALKKQERMVRLGMIGYDLTFRPNGMINVTVEYKSANVDYFSDNRNEILGFRGMSAVKPDAAAQAIDESIATAIYGDPNGGLQLELPTFGQSAVGTFQPSLSLFNPLETKKNYFNIPELSVDVQSLVSDLPTPDEAANASGSETKEGVDLQSLYSNIQGYMAKNGMIHNFDAELVDSILKGNYYFSTNPCIKSGNHFVDDISSELISFKSGDADKLSDLLPKRYTGKRNISYFFFGDLLHAVMAINPSVFEEMKKRRFAFLLDNVAYQFFKGNQISVFNVAMLPIAQSTFDDWFARNITDKEIKLLPLMSFMKNIIINFVSGIMNTKTADEIGSDYNPSIVRQLIGVPNGLEDNKEIFGLTQLSPVIGNSSYSKTAKDSYYEYYAVYDDKYYNDRLSIEMEKIEESDFYFYNLVSGIPHFYIGADKGLLKTFNFQKSSIGEQIAVIRNLEPGNAFQQLWSIFDVNLEFIGNNLMSVGKTIYLDPSITGLGSPYKKGSVSNLMGLGGHYMVTSVRHNYYPKWTTSVSAISIVPASQQATYASEDLGASFVYY
jgi:hypothetical protein